MRRNRFWKEKLMKVMDCILSQDGILYTILWQRFGITQEDEKIILDAFNRYLNAKNRRTRNATNRQQDNSETEED